MEANRVRWRSSFFVCAIVVIALSPQRALCQNGPPRLVLNTGGPVATVRAIEFAPDSESFFAAGAGKVVQRWGLGKTRRGDGIQPTVIQHLRWEVARGNRGVIYALAIAPRGDRVAFGGFSTRDAGGDIVVYDSATGDLEKVLSGHRMTVTNLAFSPDGQQLVSASIDGELRLWSAPGWQSRVLRDPNGATASPQPAVFLSNERIAAAQRDSQSKSGWRIALYDASSPGRRPAVLATRHHGLVTALARDPHSSAWASADAAGYIYIWSGTRSPDARRLARERGSVARALAFGANNSLFAATRKTTDKPAKLEMWDVESGRLVDSTTTASGEDSYACATSPDGQYVVTFGGDRYELMLFPLKDVSGDRISRPLSDGRLVRLRGDGGKVTDVAFGADGSHRIRYKKATSGQAGDDDNDSGYHAFDLDNMRTIAGPLDREDWMTPHSRSGNWSLQRDVKDRDYSLALLKSGKLAGRIELDRTYQGPARCYCWLADANGDTYGIAIGTGVQNGIFVYGLPSDGKCRLLRYFRDHQGTITSISVSADGRYLVSASGDQTIKVWSLSNVRSTARGFSRVHAWGAVFGRRDDDAAITWIDKTGIVLGRGLDKGDIIVALRYYRAGQVALATKVDDIVRALDTAPIWHNYLFSVRSPGETKVRRVLLIPGWEPLMTLFVDRKDEWAIWTPRGYYNASVNGDELFGWQINRGRFVEPRFFRADQFREDLERPEVMRRLLEEGNLSDALAATGEVDPAEGKSVKTVAKLAGEVPHIKILGPDHNAEIDKGKKVQVLARLEFPETHKPDQYEVKCYINGIRSEPPERKVDENVGTFRWESPPPNRNNRIRIVAEKPSRTANAKFAFADRYVRAKPEPKRHKLHVFAMAANQYPGKLALDYPVADANSVIEMLKTKGGDIYELSSVKLMTNKEITRRSVDRAVTELRERLKGASPEDVLLVFIAGHGIADRDDYYFVPPVEDVRDLAGAAAEVGISWQTLRRLAAIGCRKVFMLDTCYAGNIVLSEKDPAYHWKASIRPLRRSESLVICATSEGEYSWEDVDLKHGVFTYCVLEAFDGKADGLTKFGDMEPERDGAIDLAELVHYVVREVPKHTQELQTPRFTPSYLGFVPMVRY